MECSWMVRALCSLVVLVAFGTTEAFHMPSLTRRTVQSPARMGLFDFLAVGKAGASHILLSDSGRARFIKDQIDAGKLSFADAAREFSTCPSASKGGDLGTFGRGAMVGPFDSYCFDPDTQVGELGIVRTSFGTHIVKLTKKP
uniref:Peptidyl-prolyl cis-trans isomerase n=1 Tax=Haptolina brevifila TaxID=156173 RepID=A0A7S2N564_9EUKA